MQDDLIVDLPQTLLEIASAGESMTAAKQIALTSRLLAAVRPSLHFIPPPLYTPPPPPTPFASPHPRLYCTLCQQACFSHARFSELHLPSTLNLHRQAECIKLTEETGEKHRNPGDYQMYWRCRFVAPPGRLAKLRPPDFCLSFWHT